MSGRREDGLLSARERAILASLEAVAEFDDPKLARRLSTGLDRPRRRRRPIARWMPIACIAAVVTVLLVSPSYITMLIAVWFAVTGVLLLLSANPRRRRQQRYLH